MRSVSPEAIHVGVSVPIDGIELVADVALPVLARGLVIFAHGSGSSRRSPRNRHVAKVLNERAIGTVLIDLLTEQEETVDVRTAELRFNIPLLGQRLVAVTDWILRQTHVNRLKIGYFGASTGAAAALVAAAERPAVVRAVVSRGGRPDLAGAALEVVLAPTLFIVGENDPVVLDLNYSAIEKLPASTERKLEIVKGATHLFEEAGALDQVAALARSWFQTHFTSTQV